MNFREAAVLTAGLWREMASRHTPLRWIEIVLRSYGQVLFADSPLSGLLLLLALGMLSAKTLFFSLIGALAANAAARFLRRDPFYIEHGIYGFNGVIFGLFWSWHFVLSPASLGLFLAVALLLCPLQSALMKSFSLEKFALPATSLPAVLLLYGSLVAAYWLAFSAKLVPYVELFAPATEVIDPLLRVNPNEGGPLWSFIATHGLHVWAAVLVGILVFSRISFLTAAGFVLCGYAVTLLLPPSIAPAAGIYLGFNVLPAAVGLFGILLAPNRWALLYTVFGFFVCTAMFLALSGLLGFLNLPVLTLPFNLTILLLVTAAVRMGPLRSGLIPVPLDRITTPEKAIRSKRPLLGPYPQTPGFRQAAGFFRSFLPGRRPTPEEAARLAEAIRTAPSVAILSGAGTSTESGIPDFRDNPAFWLRFGAEEMTYGNFLSRPDVRERYWEMQRQFHRLIEEARPNDIHRTAVRLQEMGKLACVVTQNVDGLFQKVGVSPERVIEVHGSIRTARCTGCRTVHTDAEIEAMLGAGIAAPFCRSCRQPLKPDTIFMGEPLDEAVAGEALFRILSSGLLLVVGASLQVDPVASFADLAWRKGVRIAVVNLQPTPKDGLAEIVVRKPLGPVFRRILRELAGR